MHFFRKNHPFLSQPACESIDVTNLISQSEIQYKMLHKLAESMLNQSEVKIKIQNII